MAPLNVARALRVPKAVQFECLNGQREQPAEDLYPVAYVVFQTGGNRLLT